MVSKKKSSNPEECKKMEIEVWETGNKQKTNNMAYMNNKKNKTSEKTLCTFIKTFMMFEYRNRWWGLVSVKLIDDYRFSDFLITFWSRLLKY